MCRALLWRALEQTAPVKVGPHLVDVLAAALAQLGWILLIEETLAHHHDRLRDGGAQLLGQLSSSLLDPGIGDCDHIDEYIRGYGDQ